MRCGGVGCGVVAVSSAEREAVREAERAVRGASGRSRTPRDGYTGRSGAVSRPSQCNRQGGSEELTPPDSVTGSSDEPEGISLPTDEPITGTHLPDELDADRRLSYRGESLRPELVREMTDTGKELPIVDGELGSERSDVVPATVLEAVNEWRDWYRGYQNAHITYKNEAGETARAKLENSHMPSYENRHYARLKGLEREIGEQWERYQTMMLTLSATGLAEDGRPRATADQMRDIADGWGTARKTLHQCLEGYEWEYARIWEHHQSGYGHQHIAVFIRLDGDDDDLVEEEDMAPVMRSYCRSTDGAGSEAHDPAGDAVSMTAGEEMDNLASYLAEYLGAFDSRSPLKRDPAEQVFRSTLWATQTRRIGFSNGAQELINADLERQQEERRQERREETETRPEDRGGGEGTAEDTADAETGAAGAQEEAEEEGEEWDLDHIGFVHGSDPGDRHHTDGGGGGTRMVETDPHHSPEEIDPRRDLGDPDF